MIGIDRVKEIPLPKGRVEGIYEFQVWNLKNLAIRVPLTSFRPSNLSNYETVVTSKRNISDISDVHTYMCEGRGRCFMLNYRKLLRRIKKKKRKEKKRNGTKVLCELLGRSRLYTLKRERNRDGNSQTSNVELKPAAVHVLVYICHPISLRNPLLAYEISQTPGVVNQTIISFYPHAAKRYSANIANLSLSNIVVGARSLQLRSPLLSFFFFFFFFFSPYFFSHRVSLLADPLTLSV